MKKLIALLMSLALIFGLMGCSEALVEDGLDILADAYEEYDALQDTSEASTQDISDDPSESKEAQQDPAPELAEDGWYYSAEDVSLYLHLYGCLPENFITKNEARDLGWEGGSVEDYAPGYAIGGDIFGNREGLLPEKEGRIYRECDIDTNGADSRGAKRIVFSNDGLIYYTEDHYESFELLYGEESK